MIFELIAWIILPYLYFFGYWFLLWVFTLIGTYLLYGKNFIKIIGEGANSNSPLNKLQNLPLWKGILVTYVLAWIVTILHNLYFYGTAFFE